MVMAQNEAPVIAAGGKQAAGLQKTLKPEASQFKKKLENCMQPENVYGCLHGAFVQTSGTNDNSMAIQPPGQVQQTVVGILEGFGLLDYQSDAPATNATQQAAQADGTQTAAVWDMTSADVFAVPDMKPEAFEKYARMLSNGQLGLLAQEEKQAIIKAVGEYLGSLESTNNNPVSGTQEAAGETATVQDALSVTGGLTSDRLTALLLKLKTVARPMQEQTAGQDVEPVQEVPVHTADGGRKPTANQPAVPQAAQTAEMPKMPAAPETMHKQTKAVPEQAAEPEVPIQPATQFSAKETAPIKTETAPEVAQQTNVVQDNVTRIVEKMSTQVAEGRYDFDVDLKPDFLGRVHIKITMENGDMRMQIRTDDAAVKNMFTDQTTAMQEALKEKGVAMSSINVTCQGQMSEEPGQRTFANPGKRRRLHGRLTVDAAAGSYFDEPAELTGYGWSGSMVEYLA